MSYKIVVISIILVCLSIVFIYSYSTYSWAQTNQTPTNTEQLTTVPVCINHGGPNCSILKDDASVTCNDGTVDETYSIYAIPQCRENIDSRAQKEFDFLNNSGCYPPSEMECVSETSYQKLQKYLSAKGLADSELGKNELLLCREQVSIYESKNEDYHQCLKENNKSEFELSSKVLLPTLKAIFCPFFFGENSTYNETTDMCSCEDGYFLSEGQCTEATQICKTKYGSKASSKNGGCYLASTISIPASKTPSTTPKITPATTAIYVTMTPNISSQSNNSSTLLNQSETENNTPEINTNINFVTKIFISIASGIKNLFSLF